MSLESTMKTALSSLVSGRCYPDISPDGVAFPLIVYQQVGGKALEFVEGKLADKDHARLQVMVWSKTRLEASTLARSVRQTLVEGVTNATTYAAPVSLYDAALKLYGSRTDYSILYSP